MPFLVLFQPEIPNNVGLIIRLSVCFNAPLVIIRPMGFVWDPSKLKNSALDYLSLASISFFDSFADFASQHSGRIVATSASSSVSYSDFKFQANDAILMGKESVGLPPNLLIDLHSVKIPIVARSLNLALSSSILLSKACLDCS